MEQNICYENKQFYVLRYKQSVFRPFLPVRGKDDLYYMHFTKFIRFFQSALSKGEIYYLCDKTTDEFAGYCMLTFGKAFRYTFAGENDVSVGPILLREQYRGEKLSKLLLSVAISDHLNNHMAFAYIARTNEASKALFASAGFSFSGNLEIAKRSRVIRITDQDNTEYCLYSRELNNNQ